MSIWGDYMKQSRLTNTGIVVFLVFALMLSVMMTTGISSAESTSTVKKNMDTTEDAGYASLFDKSAITSVDITVSESEWAGMLASAQEETYISCTVAVNGSTYEAVGVRPKGNSSLQMAAAGGVSGKPRYSLKFEFDHYIEGQTCLGLDKFVLNNMMGDATWLKEFISYDMMAYLDVPSSRYAYARLTVNGEYQGLFLMLESVEESFVERVYDSEDGQLYNVKSMEVDGMKAQDGMQMPEGMTPPEGMVMPEGMFPPEGMEMPEGMTPPESMEMPDGMTPPGLSADESAQTGRFGSGRPNMGGNGMGGPGGMAGSSGGDLVYTDDKSESYTAILENNVFDTTEADEQEVITAIGALATGENLEVTWNIDEVLRYLAVHTVTVNLDSYSSSMQQNYYLYEEDGKLEIIPWDYNLAFGGFQSGTASDVVNFPIDSPVSGVDLTDRPLIAALLVNPDYLATYHTYLQELVDGYFSSGLLEETIDNTVALIATSVAEDPTAFYTPEAFEKAMPVFKALIALRMESIQGQLNGSVPSTTAAQKANPELLIDASTVDLNVLGSQGGERGNRQFRR